MNDLDLKELLKLAEQAPSEDEKKEHEVKTTEVEKFIVANDIKKGTTKISTIYIYDKYLNWKDTGKPVSNIYFFQQFSKFFEKTKMPSGIHYLLNEEGFDLSKDKYFEIRRKIRHKRLLIKNNRKFLQKELKKLVQGSIKIEDLIKEAEEKKAKPKLSSEPRTKETL